jgi:hypothetical protein
VDDLISRVTFCTLGEQPQFRGFPMSPPAYLSLTGKALRSQVYEGINFASGVSGLADTTGRLLVVLAPRIISSLNTRRTEPVQKPEYVSGAVQYGQVIPMSLQLDYFASVVEHMAKLSGSKRAASLLCKSVFFISTGSNDMFEILRVPWQ